MKRELKNILYVEDDLHVRTTAKLVLEVVGRFEVRECGSGREAMTAALDFQADLILLDMMLPELDGVATLEMLRRVPHLASTPAVFMTSLTSPADINRYHEAGALGVIPKPLMPLRLADQLHSLWEKRPYGAH